ANNYAPSTASSFHSPPASTTLCSSRPKCIATRTARRAVFLTSRICWAWPPSCSITAATRRWRLRPCCTTRSKTRGGRPMLKIIEQIFGARVAKIVDGCTDSYVEDPKKKESWEQRKFRYLRRVRQED